jgi:hypothetical protein
MNLQNFLLGGMVCSVPLSSNGPQKNSKLVVYKPFNFYWAQALCTMYEISC